MDRKNHCIVIGIAGGSGSGKTTFCTNLANSLNGLSVKTLSTDDYFKKVKPKVKAPYMIKEYEDYDHLPLLILTGYIVILLIYYLLNNMM